MQTDQPVHDPLVARLRALDACVVSDALDSLGLTGTVTGIPQRSGTGRIAGRAVTLLVGTGAPPPGHHMHLGCAAIEAAGRDSVIVIEQRSGMDAGCWGGLLSLGALVAGVAGVVADGPVRDIDEAAALGFPVFARSLTAFTARGRVVEKGTNVLVRIGERECVPGDYVLADRSAVVIVAAADITRVLEKAEALAAREAAMAAAIRSGASIGRVLGGDYEDMLGR